MRERQVMELLEETILTIMDDLTPLIQLLEGKYGWMPTVLAWVGALRLAAKLISRQLQLALTRMIESRADADILGALLSNKIYRGIAFVIDLFSSVKLPSAADLKKEES